MTPRPLSRRPSAVFALLAALLAIQSTALLAMHATAAPDRVKAGDRPSGPSAGLAFRTGSTGSQWTDVSKSYWARGAIDAVAYTHTWMRDYGATTFRPTAFERREQFAKAVVRAFAPNEQPDPNLTFDDVPADDPHAPTDNVAVKLGWMVPTGKDFRPDDAVTTREVHRALTFALGLRSVVAGINKIHTTDGYVFKHPADLGVMLLGNVLGLRYNHENDESLDVGPGDKLSRAEVAWSLAQANVIQTSETWRKTSVQVYKAIHLGPVPEAFRPVVEFGLRYVGYPYIYAGEWGTKTPVGYCCGAQPRGGFDCSGLMWWVLRAPDSMYDNTKVRPYKGFILNERSSNDMAHAIVKAKRLTFDETRAGDLLFYDGDSNGTIDHVDLSLGWGWALDSGSDGVTVLRVADPNSWYQRVFAWGRKLVPAPTS